MEKIMAVYDVDQGYAQRFADVVNQKEKAPFTVVPFSTLELLREFAKTHRVEILLISSAVSRQQVEGIEAGAVVTLSEGEMVPTAEEDYPAVYKYQSADNVVREVMARYCEQPGEEMYVMLGTRSKVLGIYSPLGRCLKTSLALLLGQQLAREGKTIYVGFEEFSGLQQIIGGEHKYDLSDVLYFLRQESFSVVRLRSLVYTWKDMDYIAPVRYPEDLEQMSGDEAAGLIEKLASESGYEYIVVDVGRMGRNLMPILERCDVIYMPVRDDSMSSAKLNEFDRYLEATGHQAMTEKIKRLKLPFRNSPRQGADYLEQILWGELGDYVRRLLKGAVWK